MVPPKLVVVLVAFLLCACDNFDPEFPTGYIQCEPLFKAWPKFRFAKDAEVRNGDVIATAVYEDGGRRKQRISLILVENCREF